MKVANISSNFCDFVCLGYILMVKCIPHLLFISSVKHFNFFSPAQKLLVFEFQLGPAQKAEKKT